LQQLHSNTSLSYQERLRDRPFEVSAAGSTQMLNTVPIPASNEWVLGRWERDGFSYIRRAFFFL